MKNMLNMKIGCKITAADQLTEGYESEGYSFAANVNVDKIEAVLQHFICMHEEPLFLILELPANLDDENQVRPGVVETLHKDIYYIDGCSQEEALAFLEREGKLLINDGISTFGFGCHESGDEIMSGKYNVLTIYSQTPELYADFFEQHDIPKTQHLITAWDTFSEENPGVAEKITLDRQDVFYIPEKYKNWGIYKAERREE